MVINGHQWEILVKGIHLVVILPNQWKKDAEEKGLGEQRNTSITEPL